MAKRAERGKAYYMISAVSQKYNIHPQTLRLYEREGLLKPSRTEGNTRLYSEEDLEQLETILALTRDLGVNLAGVEIILNMRRKIEQMQGEVNEFMDYVKRELARGIDDWEQRLEHRARQVVADRSREAHDQYSGRRRKCEARKSKVKSKFAWRSAFRKSALRSRRALRDLRRHRMEDDRGRRCLAGHALRLHARVRARRGCSPTRASRAATSTATSTTSPPTTSSCSKALQHAHAARRSVSRSSTRACSCRARPASARRTSRWPCCGRSIRTRGARGIFYDTRDLLRVIRSTYDPVEPDAEMDVLRPVIEADLLVLDDLGAEKTSEWVEETLNLIVNTRYSERGRRSSRRTTTTIPTTPTRTRCSFRIGFRMRSRLHEMCEFLDLDGADYRELPPNGGVDDLIDAVEDCAARRRARPSLPAPQPAARRAPSCRASADGKADLKWSGGRAGT